MKSAEKAWPLTAIFVVVDAVRWWPLVTVSLTV
jgi:hypothetical protein